MNTSLRFLKFILNRIKLHSLLSVIAATIFSIVLRFIFQYYLHSDPIRGVLGLLDIIFFLNIGLFKFIFGAILEYYFGNIIFVPISTIFNKCITWMVDQKDSSSTLTLPMQDSLKLLDDMQNNTKVQDDMITRLEKLKTSKDLKLIIDKEGNLDLDTPPNVSDKELSDLSKQVGIIDRIIRTKFSEYKELRKKDVESNNGTWSEAHDDYVKHLKESYNNLFEKE